MEQQSHDAHETVVNRFTQQDAAAIYAGKHENSATHRRECRCIVTGLEGVEAGSHILDLPCGAGRFLPLLLGMGYRVTEADVGPEMVDEAKAKAEAENMDLNKLSFDVADIMDSPYEDKAFDAVLCNRLFHHFPHSDLRQNALRELGRICKGPIIVSYFANLAWDSFIFHMRHKLTRTKPPGRIPIWASTFNKDAEAAGLKVVQTLKTRPGISKQWYAVLRCND
jgi:SAM-dependent methyltransferase